MTDALNTDNDLLFQYPAFETWLSEDADPPTEVDQVQNPVCLRVSRSAGSALDYADFAWGLSGPLHDRTQPAEFTRVIEARLSDDDNTILFRGDYVYEEHAVTAKSESLSAQAQQRSYHFGKPFEGMPHWSPAAAANVIVKEGPLFNPQVDERQLPNRATKELSGSVDAKIWVDAMSVQTAAGKTYHDATGVTTWSLKEAVYTMCKLCNPDEDHVDNPTRAELAVLDDAPELRNVQLEIGQYLPTYLDSLLQPSGYNWFVKPTGGPDTFSRKIVCFKRGAGTEKELKLQAIGEALDLAESNTNQFTISNRIGDSVNEVEVLGDLETRQITIPLQRNWASSADGLDRLDLDKNDGASYAANKSVWREFVGNEGGDYNGLRAEITAPPDLSTVFSEYVPRRRAMEDPLTYVNSSSLERHPILVEYSDTSGTSWEKLPDSEAGSVVALPGQIGIRFNGDKPPAVLVDAGSAARVRITCTIKGDVRVRGFAEKQSTAVNGRTVAQTILAETRFVDRSVVASGTFTSTLTGTADTRNDTTAIQTYAEKLRDQYEVAEIAASVELPGIHLDYEIGDLLTKIAGRELSLNMASPEGTARYPQITGITYDLSDRGPVTRLTIDRGQST